jgi:thiamine-phosphate pyrophosphorylase
MCKRICITNRKLVKGDFVEQIKRLTATNIDIFILREKDLEEDVYMELAKKVMKICEDAGKLCILHTFADVALKLNCKAIHLPLQQLRDMPAQTKSHFEILGASIHSVEEALEAEKLGATYVTASHIFPTACKQGLPPRGLEFLRQVTEAVDIPVYALGGICEEKSPECINAGAEGVCMMSEYMVS